MLKITLVLVACLTALILSVCAVRKLRAKTTILLLALGLIAGVFAWNQYPKADTSSYHEVVVTATQKMNAAAEGNEIWLKGAVVDGKFFAAEELLAQGKWVKQTEFDVLVWRSYQTPDNMTSEIVLHVPMGIETELVFMKNMWRGIAQVSVDEHSMEIDCYANEETNEVDEAYRLPVSMTAVKDWLPIVMKLLMLWGMLFFGVLLVVFCYRQKTLKARIKKHRFVLVIATIAAAQLIVAMRYSGIDSFWLDEFYEIGWSLHYTNIIDRAFAGAAPLPIFGMLMGLWYDIAPYGERWLLLPFEIVTAAGIFFIGLAGKEACNKHVGVLSALLAALSSTVLVQCSYEIRSYGFFFTGAAVLLFLFVRHVERRKTESWKSVILMSACMIFFAGMHYHAVLSCVMLFAIDLTYLVYVDGFDKKLGVKLVVPYALAALSYIPNLYDVFFHTNKIAHIEASDWMLPPSFSEVKKLFSYLSSNLEIIPFLFLVGATVGLVLLAFEKGKKQKDKAVLKVAVPALWVTSVVVFLVVFGNWRYANGGSTLWVDRYFCGILPAFFVVAGTGIYSIAKGVQNACADNVKNYCMVLVIILALLIPAGMSNLVASGKTVRYPYREAADWLYAQDQYINKDDTIVVATNFLREIQGWEEYYLTKQGQREPIKVVDQYSVTSESLQQYNRVYVQRIHYDITDAFTDILHSEFTLVESHPEIKVNVYVRK